MEAHPEGKSEKRLAVHKPNFLFYKATCLFLRIYLALFHRFSAKGRELVPRDAPVILVANHCSNLDPIVIGPSFPRPLRYLAKTELFQNALLRLLITNLGAIPVEREDSQRAGAVLKMLLSLLEGGESILLFPEGHRSRDGKLQKLEGGFALLAMRTGAQIVPACIEGTFAAWPAGADRIRFAKLGIRYGAPIDPRTFAPELPEKERRQALVDLVTEKMREMAQVADGGNS